MARARSTGRQSAGSSPRSLKVVPQVVRVEAHERRQSEMVHVRSGSHVSRSFVDQAPQDSSNPNVAVDDRSECDDDDQHSRQPTFTRGRELSEHSAPRAITVRASEHARQAANSFQPTGHRQEQRVPTPGTRGSSQPSRAARPRRTRRRRLQRTDRRRPISTIQSFRSVEPPQLLPN